MTGLHRELALGALRLTGRRMLRLFGQLGLVVCFSVLLASPGAVLANSLAERYPLNGWTSLEQVERALAEVSAERMRIEQDFVQASRACQQRFLVNDCLRQAQDQKNSELAVLDAIDTAAIRYRRTTLDSQRSRQREQAEAQRVRDERAEAEQRARNASTQQQLIEANRQAEAERRRAAQTEAEQRARNATTQQQFIEANQQAEAERTQAAPLEAAQRAENARIQQRFIEANEQRSGETIVTDPDAAQRARELERLRLLRDGPAPPQ